MLEEEGSDNMGHLNWENESKTKQETIRVLGDKSRVMVTWVIVRVMVTCAGDSSGDGYLVDSSGDGYLGWW